MNIHRNIIPALAALLMAGAASAQEGTQDFQNIPQAAKTRAQVIAELEQARRDGTRERGGEAYGSFQGNAFASSRTRAEVLAEYDAARRARALDTHSYSATNRSIVVAGEAPSSRTREEVRAELAAAQKAIGGLSRGERTRG
jgi:Domain of unknown function (DUF4148)